MPTKNNVRPWTAADKRLLRASAKAGNSSTLVALELDRSPGAVRQMALLENVRFSSLGSKHSRLQKARWK